MAMRAAAADMYTLAYHKNAVNWATMQQGFLTSRSGTFRSRCSPPQKGQRQASRRVCGR